MPWSNNCIHTSVLLSHFLYRLTANLRLISSIVKVEMLRQVLLSHWFQPVSPFCRVSRKIAFSVVDATRSPTFTHRNCQRQIYATVRLNDGIDCINGILSSRTAAIESSIHYQTGSQIEFVRSLLFNLWERNKKSSAATLHLLYGHVEGLVCSVNILRFQSLFPLPLHYSLQGFSSSINDETNGHGASENLHSGNGKGSFLPTRRSEVNTRLFTFDQRHAGQQSSRLAMSKIDPCWNWSRSVRPSKVTCHSKKQRPTRCLIHSLNHFPMTGRHGNVEPNRWCFIHRSVVGWKSNWWNDSWKRWPIWSRNWRHNRTGRSAPTNGSVPMANRSANNWKIWERKRMCYAMICRICDECNTPYTKPFNLNLNKPIERSR